MDEMTIFIFKKHTLVNFIFPKIYLERHLNGGSSTTTQVVKLLIASQNFILLTTKTFYYMTRHPY